MATLDFLYIILPCPCEGVDPCGCGRNSCRTASGLSRNVSNLKNKKLNFTALPLRKKKGSVLKIVGRGEENKYINE